MFGDLRDKAARALEKIKSGEFDTSFLDTFNYDPTKYAYKEENE